MKKIVLSLLLVFSMLLALASCDMLGKKDDPEKNVDYLVSSLNEGTNFDELQENTQSVDFEKLLAKVKELVFEADASATMDGESGTAYVGMKDMVLYTSNSDGDEVYIFIEDDWTLVNVYGWDDEYYGYADTTLKDMIAAMTATEGDAEQTTPEDDAATDMVATILDAIMSADLPDATAEDVEYKDGKYYLSEDYIKSILNKYVDVVLDDLGLTANDILDYKAVVKGYLEYINLEIYYYIECEEITGVGMAVTFDETFAAEKIGYSDIAVSFEVCTDKFAVAARVANEDDVLADISASVEFATDKNDKLKTLKVDVNAKVNTPGYGWDEDTEDYAETVSETNLVIDLDADFAAMEKGNGEFMTFSASYSYGETNAEISVKASSADKGDKISCDITAAMKDGSETENITVDLEANMKSADKMPAVPQGAIDAKDQALEDLNNEDIWY